MHVISLHMELERHARYLRDPAHHCIFTPPFHLELQLRFPIGSLHVKPSNGPALATYFLVPQGPTQFLEQPLGDLTALVLYHEPTFRVSASVPKAIQSEREAYSLQAGRRHDIRG